MIKKFFTQYVEENKYDIYIISMLLIIGFFVGVGLFFLINAEVSNQLINAAKSVFDASMQADNLKINVILNGVKVNLILIIAFLLFSITLIGRVFIYFSTILKGISIGIYSCIIFSIFNIWWGLVVTCLLVVLINLVYIPAYIYLASTLLAFNFGLFNTKKENTSWFSVTKVLTKTIAVFVFMFSSSIVEHMLTGVVFTIYEKIV
ncbi:MAG: hypothetical protein IKV94_02890 [Clostridia bacterium]|nr:hypothetical protein [Clostridia bacterium]